MKQSHKPMALFMLFLSIVSWAQAPVFIRYLREAYDPFSMAFIRYGSGTVALVVVCMLFYRAEFFRLLRRPAPILGITALNIFQQWAWTAGCYGSSATMANVISKLELVFVILFSYFLFHEERRVIRSPMYLLGSLMGLVGVAAVLTKDPTSLRPVLDKSSILLLMTTVCWGTYRVWSKHIVMTWHPIPMFAVLALFTTVGFAVLTFLLGQPDNLVSAGPRLTMVALFSGLMPIAVAHPSFNYAQKYLGSAFCTSVGLLGPLATYAIALLLLPDEHLRLSQWLGAATLLSGAFMIIWSGRRNRA